MDNTFFICSCLLVIGIAYLASTSIQSEYHCDPPDSCRLKRTFVAGFKDQLIQIEIDPLGHHTQLALLTTANDITSMAYSPNSNNLYMIDKASKSIYSMNLQTKDSEIIFEFEEPSDITAIVYDFVDNNLFYCDSGMRTVNVLNLDSMEMKPIVKSVDEIPKAIAVDPEDYIMFVAFEQTANVLQWRVDRFKMDGTERRHILAGHRQGPIMLHYDSDLHRIFWTDGFKGRIESMDINGEERKQIKGNASHPSGLTSSANDVFWINRGTVELMWINKMKLGNTDRVMLDVSDEDTETAFSLVAITKVRASRQTRTAGKPCKEDEFQCKSGLCIPKSWECDFEADCFDRSDEHAKCRKTECGPRRHKFVCDNDRCIDRSLECNQIDDCGDLSDELYCGDEPHCLPTEFQCNGNYTLCIPKIAVCNGTSECPGLDDELHCHCQGNQYECENRKCIPKEWMCDGTDDCEDGFASDENNYYCAPYPLTPGTRKWTLCDYGYKCNNGHCIDRRFLCDNMTYDCADKSDENGTCATSCLEPKTKCDHECISTPTGHICTCPKGFILDDDYKSCRDIDECNDEYPICSQKCTNKIGDYECSCHAGFTLREDMKSCKHQGEAPTFFFAVDNEIRNMSLVKNHLTVLYDDINDGIAGMDVDIHNKFIYFTLKSQGIIKRASIDGKANADDIKIAGRVEPSLIAVDWLTQNVYVIEGVANKQFLSVCSFDYMTCRHVGKLPSEQRVRAIVIDPINRFIFTSLTHWHESAVANCRVHRMALDGGDYTTLLKSDDCDISSLALDIPAQTVYYSDRRQGALFKMAYDGSNHVLLYNNRQMPHSLQLFDNTLYLLERHGVVAICKLHDFKLCERYRLISPTSQMFTIAQSSRQPRAPNMCEDKPQTNCELCVPTKKGPMCYCEDLELVTLHENCTQLTRFPVDKDGDSTWRSGISKGTDWSKSSGNRNKSRSIGNYSEVVLISVISSTAIIALAASIIGGWYCYKKREALAEYFPAMQLSTLRTRREQQEGTDSALMPVSSSPDAVSSPIASISGSVLQTDPPAVDDPEAL